MPTRPFHRQRLPGFAHSLCLLSLLLAWASLNSFADEPSPPNPIPTVAGGVDQTNLNELLQNSTQLLQTISKLQSQVTAQQQMLEQGIRDAKETAAQNAVSVTSGLQRLERAFSEQQQAYLARSEREVEAMQSANRNMLIIVATFAATGFLAMLVTACFQWRMSKAWARISTALPMAWLGRHSAVSSGSEIDSATRVEDSNLRLLAAMERIEKRIQGLEQSSKPSLKLHT